MIIILMGVSGSGKTTIGQMLAHDLGCPFRDADEFHPPANIEKMSRSIPLTDEDRAAWLDALHDAIHQTLQNGEQAVFSCSALKQRYRDRLLRDNDGARLVYLKGDYNLILNRLQARRGHFFKPELLASQFADLEEPGNVLTVDISPPPEAVVAAIKRVIL